jgi:phosphatidylglycerophosphate synthase
MSLNEHESLAVEKALFESVYKGVTDLVTKWVWPVPAFWVTLCLSYFRIHPNVVTLSGMALMFVAAWQFFEGNLVAGLSAAWAMTFLDTVDGKLARVTATSSRLGDRLDHITDLVHPPIWWACLAWGLGSNAETTVIEYSYGIILITYLVGRWTEKYFKKSLGFNQFIWQPFDSAFRLIISRRNTILLTMTAGLILGDPASAYVASAAWSVVSVAIQLVRLRAAWIARPVRSWLQGASESARSPQSLALKGETG